MSLTWWILVAVVIIVVLLIILMAIKRKKSGGTKEEAEALNMPESNQSSIVEAPADVEEPAENEQTPSSPTPEQPNL